MSGAVDFNHQPVFDACKVGDEQSDWVLTAEFQTAETMASQPCPQCAFGRRLFAAQAACASQDRRMDWWFVIHDVDGLPAPGVSLTRFVPLTRNESTSPTGRGVDFFPLSLWERGLGVRESVIGGQTLIFS